MTVPLQCWLAGSLRERVSPLLAPALELARGARLAPARLMTVVLQMC